MDKKLPSPPLQSSVPPAGDPIDRAAKWAAAAAALVGVALSANTFIAGFAKEEAARYEAFRTATSNEEKFWKSLWDDYLTVFDEPTKANPDPQKESQRRRAKVLAIYTLAQRKLPTFVEFEVDDSEKQEAAQHLSAMQAGLLNSLEEGAGDPVLRAELLRRSYAGKLDIESNALPAKYSAPVTLDAERLAPPAPTAQTADFEVPSASFELSPPSKIGWDVDLFWCQGPSEKANYRLARGLGESLATFAKSGRSIAPRVALGRVRIRPATVAWQAMAKSPARKSWIVHDRGPGEREAAVALQRAINSSSNEVVMGLGVSDGDLTRWYLTGFICGGDSLH